MSTFWNKQIERADYLAAEASGSKELLAFYAQLLRAQEGIYESFRSRKNWLPSGDLESDMEVVQLTMTGVIGDCCAVWSNVARLGSASTSRRRIEYYD